MRLSVYSIAKRLIDVVSAFFGLLVTSPILLPVMYLVWRQDKHSPFYVAERVGKDFKPFKMVKLRSMIKNADSSGVDSTSVNDMRITPIGQFIRRYKLDELTQLWNVLIGDMSLVGPRPNVKREVDMYTTEEKKLLILKPGITDFASIVFSDEGDILSEYNDPDLAYNQLIRPGKSLLGLFYINSRKLWVDFLLLFITVLAVVSRVHALRLNTRLIKYLGAPTGIALLASRSEPLSPMPPPGTDKIVTSRTLNE